MGKALNDLIICIKSAGEMASGIACLLYNANFRNILMLETESPLAVRRQVSFSEAVYSGSQTVEGVKAIRSQIGANLQDIWNQSQIPVIVDPDWSVITQIKPDVVIDAILAKQNLGTRKEEADLVIGLGPGFTAGHDVDLVIETNRGHSLGRIITLGIADKNTGVPGSIDGYSCERVLRAPSEGEFKTSHQIGDQVKQGDTIGTVNEQPIATTIDGVIRGLLKDKTRVKKGLKLGDVDPRGDVTYCHTVSEKARAIGGAVLTAVLSRYNR